MTAAIIRRLVTAALGLWAASLLFRQCRKPTGWFGRRVARVMNIGHSRLTRWGLGYVRIEPDWHVLDIGCGGGQTVRSIAAMTPAGRVEGIDYAPASVAVTRETNGDLIASGRVTVRQGSVSALPFPDSSFDLITAVETHYYWPNLQSDLREVRRVLKPHGRFVIIAETFKGRHMDWLYRPVMRFLLRATYLSVDEHRAALTEAGFSEVEVHTDAAYGWLCAIGMRRD
jgi:ubiquinone/menaquinone biosynthesis C-methylase UbiE